MKKLKKITIFTVIIILILLVAIIILNNEDITNNENTINNEDITNNEVPSYYIIYNNYSSVDSQIISNYTEYQLFIKECNFSFDNTKYGRDYFISNAIAIISISTSNTAEEIKNIEIEIESNTLICNVYIEYTSMVGGDVMGGAVYLAEISNNITELEMYEWN